MNVIKDFLKTREGYLGIFCVLFFVFLCLTSNFGNDLYSYFKDVSYMIIGGLAACLIIMTANIDISSGTILGIVGFVSGSLLKLGVPIPAVILIAMGVGFINAYILAFVTIKFRVPSMVVSLAMIKLHIGLFPLLPAAGRITNIPSDIIAMGNIRFGFVPLLLIIALAILIFFMWFMKYTKFGRDIYAAGGSPDSAKLSGIKPNKVIFKTFLVSGCLLGITGIMFWLPSSQVQPSGCIGLEMTFITIAVVSGASMFGGTGRPIGILFAAMLVAMLQRACILWNLGNAWLYTFYGIIVILAVLSTVSDFGELKRRLLGVKAQA